MGSHEIAEELRRVRKLAEAADARARQRASRTQFAEELAEDDARLASALSEADELRERAAQLRGQTETEQATEHNDDE